MENCHKKLVAALILIIAAVLCGVGVILYFQINQPVFFYHYGSYQLMTDQQTGQTCWKFTLKYVANVDDRRTVTDIEFPDAANSGLTFTSSEDKPDPQATSTADLLSDYAQPQNGQNIGRYSLHTVTVTAVPAADKAADGTILQQAVVHYSNHKSQPISLGSIELCQSNSRDSEFTWFSDTCYSNELKDSTVQANDDITLLSLEPQCPPELLKYIHYQVNGTDYNQIDGMKCAKGSNLVFHLENTLNDDAVMKQNDYNIRILVRYLDDQGNEHESLLDFISHTPTRYNFWDIARYLKARKAI